jgi:hypothetical protein
VYPNTLEICILGFDIENVGTFLVVKSVFSLISNFRAQDTQSRLTGGVLKYRAWIKKLSQMYPGQVPNPQRAPPPPASGAPPYGYPPPQGQYGAPPQGQYGAPPQGQYGGYPPAPYGAPPAAGGANFSQFGLAYNPYDYNSWANPQYFAPQAGPSPLYNVSPAQFQSLRSNTTKDAALKQLCEIGKDLSRLKLSEFQSPITRVCFMCVNSYTDPAKALGVGPLNDAVTVGANHRLLNYFIYFLHNPTTRQFMDYLNAFLNIVTENLTVYYSGHGSQVADRNHDEADGKDEVMVFDQGFIVDDDLAAALKKNCNGRCKVVLISDCCRSGTIWDIPEDVSKAERAFPPNIISLSASRDSQTSKQASGLGNVRAAQGLFTFHFFRIIRQNPRITAAQVVPLVNQELKSFQQTCTVLPTRREMMNQPIFPR